VLWQRCAAHQRTRRDARGKRDGRWRWAHRCEEAPSVRAPSGERPAANGATRDAHARQYIRRLPRCAAHRRTRRNARARRNGRWRRVRQCEERVIRSRSVKTQSPTAILFAGATHAVLAVTIAPANVPQPERSWRVTRSGTRALRCDRPHVVVRAWRSAGTWHGIVIPTAFSLRADGFARRWQVGTSGFG
jgi:hypothetical protein